MVRLTRFHEFPKFIKLKPANACCAAGLKPLQQMHFNVISYTVVSSLNSTIAMHLYYSITECCMVHCNSIYMQIIKIFPGH
jgi:hypothetical protein